MPNALVRRGAAAAALLLMVPAAARAHAVVYPKRSAPGAYEKYVLRVPNEKTSATTRVEIRFPAGLRVTSFADVPGWTLETVTDSAGAITSAVWTGTLPPKRFVELPFVAANPKTPTRLVWPTFQTYADGERVEWTQGEGEKRPASSTEIAAPADSARSAAPGGAPSGTPLLLAGGALIVSMVALGLALRRPS